MFANQSPGTWSDHCYLDIIVFRLSQGTPRKYVCVYTYTIYIYYNICPFMYIEKENMIRNDIANSNPTPRVLLCLPSVHVYKSLLQQ